ncbi:MAG TPA: putative porin [Terriglobales bacterium]|nr:putative porin [Terriglobales bacterium]
MIIAIAMCANALSQDTVNASHSETHAAKKKSLPSAAELEVQQLKEVVQAQQQQINQQGQQVDELRTQLQQFVEATQRASAAAQNLQNGADQAQKAAAQAQQSAADAQAVANQASTNAAQATTALGIVQTQTSNEATQLTALEAIAGRFRLSGDVRVRGESYDQNTLPDRNRARIRARIGLDGQLNEDFVGGIAVATGSLGDPTSTNETLTNVFDRKTIALDRAFVTFNPVAHRWISLTGGKFAYTWQRTSATFDPDLNPEGFNEKFSFDFGGALKNFTVQGIELLYNESTAAQDSYAVGGQISARFQLGPWTTTPSFLSLKWNRPDAILQESAFATQATTTGVTGSSSATTFGPFPTSGEGQGCAKGLGFPAYSPCVFAPNGLTNATFVDSKGVPHFYSGYNYADFILNNQIQTPAKRLPLNLLVEFEENLDAEAHPLNSKGTVQANLGSQNKEYGADFSLGQTKNKNDVQFGYAWYREEQDAAIASFVESDQRAPTNIIQNRFYVLWKLHPNTVASFSWWHGRTLNTNLENNAALFNTWSTANKGTTITAAGQPEPYLNRLQFDLIYTF